MRIDGNTILITGGATGIGLALVKEFLNYDNEVIICGRRKNKLEDAKKMFPEIHTQLCDVSSPKERDELYKWIIAEFYNLNILVNNAGIQKIINFKNGTSELDGDENEILINLEAPVYLSAKFIPGFLKQKKSAIINITSGLGFIPLAIMPVYCATKAALHSFSISLRYQLKDTNLNVFEIIPPIVDTELDRGTRETRGIKYRGIKPEEVAKETIEAIKNNFFEHAIGDAQNLTAGSRQNPEEIFSRMNF
jgi:uncharacterized oxidoreductase